MLVVILPTSRTENLIVFGSIVLLLGVSVQVAKFLMQLGNSAHFADFLGVKSMMCR